MAWAIAQQIERKWCMVGGRVLALRAAFLYCAIFALCYQGSGRLSPAPAFHPRGMLYAAACAGGGGLPRLFSGVTWLSLLRWPSMIPAVRCMARAGLLLLRHDDCELQAKRRFVHAAKPAVSHSDLWSPLEPTVAELRRRRDMYGWSIRCRQNRHAGCAYHVASSFVVHGREEE